MTTNTMSKTKLGGQFTLPGTSSTVRRIGYLDNSTREPNRADQNQSSEDMAAKAARG